MCALDRCTSRRGQPELMHSDNDTNSVGAETVLEVDLKEVAARLANCGVDWWFTPSLSPHQNRVQVRPD